MKLAPSLHYALRSLIPSWRFFNEIEGAYILMIRPVGGAETDWVRVDPRSETGVSGLIHNPSGILIHAFHNFLKLAARDRDCPEIQEMLRDLAEQQGRIHFPGSDAFETRIVEEIR